jgi:hypothetical protein
MTRVRSSDGGTRITVVLEDLAGDDGCPLGSAVVGLPPGRAGVLVEITGGPGVTARLLQGCADHLRAVGRLRLTASCPSDRTVDLDTFAAAGFRRVRQHEGQIDLILEL